MLTRMLTRLPGVRPSPGTIEEMAAIFLMAALLAASGPLETARDRQDRPALEKQISELSIAAQKAPHDAEAQYRVALAASYLAEVSLEMRDKNQAQRAAESGIQAAGRAIAINSRNAEYYRVLGTLCGQVIPASVLSAFSYGKRAREAIDKALELDPKSSRAYLARGVGNYYLPDALGGGASLAVPDFRKAADLDPSSAEPYLWLGLALRKEHHNAEARQAFEKAMRLDPARTWIKLQLEKTPAQ
jgi:tetratricopeptide (TPR) repeat protein